MKLIKLLSIVLLLSTSTLMVHGAENSTSHLNQVRNSLWVFGVDNGLTTEVELVGQGIEGLVEPVDHARVEQTHLEVPEELGMVIHKFES